jgi:hypothetical protein
VISSSSMTRWSVWHVWIMLFAGMALDRLIVHLAMHFINQVYVLSWSKFCL